MEDIINRKPTEKIVTVSKDDYEAITSGKKCHIYLEPESFFFILHLCKGDNKDSSPNHFAFKGKYEDLVKFLIKVLYGEKIPAKGGLMFFILDEWEWDFTRFSQ